MLFFHIFVLGLTKSIDFYLKCNLNFKTSENAAVKLFLRWKFYLWLKRLGKLVEVSVLKILTIKFQFVKIELKASKKSVPTTHLEVIRLGRMPEVSSEAEWVLFSDVAKSVRTLSNNPKLAKNRCLPTFWRKKNFLARNGCLPTFPRKKWKKYFGRETRV